MIAFASTFQVKMPMKFKLGRYTVKTLDQESELLKAYSLRYQVFQAETVKSANQAFGLDQDQFDQAADHLGIFDDRSGELIATCRLNCSLFVKQFYSELEFDCRSLIDRPETKLEIGRVCVHQNFRSGIVLMLLWRAIAEYMAQTRSEILFGCGSVMTQDPKEALILYRYLLETGRVKWDPRIVPAESYRFTEMEKLLFDQGDRALTPAETDQAIAILPPLCQSYFDMGCYVPGLPAIDTDFQCIDFLTVLESRDLSPRLRKKLMGETSI